MRKFNQDEIREIIRTAQIFAPQFTEKNYQMLASMQEEMVESGFIEAAYGLHRLQQEYDIPCAEALEKYPQLIKERDALESRVAQLKKRREAQENRLRQVTEALAKAEEERRCQENEQQSLRKQVAEETKRLNWQLERAREEAAITNDEIASAGKLKARVEGHGIDLELALRFFKEFTCSKDAATSLAQAVAEYGSELQAKEALRQENDTLKNEIEERLEKRDQLEKDCQDKQAALTQLREDIAEEERLRHFHQRYGVASPVLEYLSNLEQVIPLRCHMAFCSATFWVNRGPSHFRAKYVCPCCGHTALDYDEQAFNALGVSFRGPFKIELGGKKRG